VKRFTNTSLPACGNLKNPTLKSYLIIELEEDQWNLKALFAFKKKIFPFFDFKARILIEKQKEISRHHEET
jgi:hypothetical protein